MPPKLQELRDEAVKIDSQLQSLATKKTQLMKDLDKYIRDGSAVEKEIRDLEKAFSHALLCCAMMEHPDGKPLLHTLKDMRQTRAQTIGEHQTIITRIQEIQNEELNEAVSKVQEQSTKLQSEKNANESIKQKQDEKLSYLESVLNKSKAESEQQTCLCCAAGASDWSGDSSVETAQCELSALFLTEARHHQSTHVIQNDIRLVLNLFFNVLFLCSIQVSSTSFRDNHCS
eukprot:m.1298576 g.1298576  ORF g.1298576 m.1298576 type:complete len:230 (-) comp24798_c1_seq85:974-1663(-)